MSKNIKIKCSICYTEISPEQLNQHFRMFHADRPKMDQATIKEIIQAKARVLVNQNESLPGNRTVECPICLEVLQQKSMKGHFFRLHPGHEVPDISRAVRKRKGQKSGTIVSDMKMINTQNH